MKLPAFLVLLALSPLTAANDVAKIDYEHRYPFTESVSQLVEKTSVTDNLTFFGRAAGRCAAMFRSMHVLLVKDDPTQPHPTLEKYYGDLIDVYRDIGTQKTSSKDLSAKELPGNMVKDAKTFLDAYYYWMTWNKRISGDYVEHSPAMQRELKDCQGVLEISGII
ncbi:MAG: hypothetical protein AAGJ37_00855 [Pseudomonadota bacterium]